MLLLSSIACFIVSQEVSIYSLDGMIMMGNKKKFAMHNQRWLTNFESSNISYTFLLLLKFVNVCAMDQSFWILQLPLYSTGFYELVLEPPILTPKKRRDTPNVYYIDS